MGKLTPAQVSYLDDCVILYCIYMMMGHFISQLFEGTLHVDNTHVQFKITNIIARATHSSPPADWFHTETGGHFATTWYHCKILYQSVILAPVQQPGWTHARVTHAGMTFCDGIM